MKLAQIYEPIVESGWVPDLVTRTGIRTLLARRSASLKKATITLQDAAKRDYITSLKKREEIALHTKEANEQEAEEAMLEIYCERAQVQDGMTILDLGCGWGSLSLFLAKKYPNAQITGLSNSSTQREFIMHQANDLGLSNIEILTMDINTATIDRTFDRIISIEMFEHMKNYSKLLEKVSGWLKSESGRLFVHVFAHKEMPYDFKTEEDNSWMATHFFTGDLFMWFQEHLTVLDRWVVSGTNYGKTSEDWLLRMDKNKREILEIFRESYGVGNEEMWFQRWRIFYLAVAETFAYDNGQEWPVVHYLFKRK